MLILSPLLLLAPLTHLAAAASCSNNLTTKTTAPVAADGWHYRLIANGFTHPRSIAFDSAGALLVLDQGKGVFRLTLEDLDGTCLNVRDKSTVVSNEALNHGLALSSDGKTLYASSPNDVYAWPYDASSGAVHDVSSPRVLVTNMTNTGHTSRTLLVASTGDLLVSRGSAGNADPLALAQSSGHCQIRLFGANSSSVDFPSGGQLAGWGLRNSVGVAEHPKSGGIWSVENSVDNLHRLGSDIHNDNPGEELNYHGTVSQLRGANHGYPVCYALWGTDGVPSLGNLTTGNQFAVDAAEDQAVASAETDASCNADFAQPEITFQAHTAPLDIKFDANGTTAYISFHGSCYAVGAVAFDATTGRPTAARDSKDAVTNILSNKDITKCAGGCIRPVGLAWDSQGRLWVSSDKTGEIFVLFKGTQKWDDPPGGGNDGTANESAAGRGRVDLALVVAGLVSWAVGVL